MPEFKCHLLEETTKVQVLLRRWRSSEKRCAVGFHHAEDVYATIEAPGDAGHPASFQPFSDEDLRAHPGLEDACLSNFPDRCACGEGFAPGDMTHVNYVRLWMHPVVGLVTEHEAPSGSVMFRPEDYCIKNKTRPKDGSPCLHVMIPDGHWWNADGPASNGDGWQRRGEVPHGLVATPSIGCPDCHGWLGGPSGERPGFLVMDKMPSTKRRTRFA